MVFLAVRVAVDRVAVRTVRLELAAQEIRHQHHQVKEILEVQVLTQYNHQEVVVVVREV